jgi:hypothetical protein
VLGHDKTAKRSKGSKKGLGVAQGTTLHRFFEPAKGQTDESGS